MGATTAQTVFGKITTVHPSYLLRLPDADAKAREYQRFVDEDCREGAEKIGARGLGGVPRMLRSAPGSALRAARAQAPRCAADPGPIVSHGSWLCGAPPKRRCTASGTRRNQAAAARLTAASASVVRLASVFFSSCRVWSSSWAASFMPSWVAHCFSVP